MSNPFDDALGLAEETARQMRGANKPLVEYQGDSDLAVKGWIVHRYPVNLPEDKSFSNAPGDFEEYWGQHVLVLSSDGKLYEYRETNTQYGSARSGGEHLERVKSLRTASSGDLVRLGPGKPFAALTSILERLPWL